MPNLLDVPGAAEFLKLNEYTLRRLARDRQIPAFKVGRGWRFSMDSLREWVRAQEALPAAPAVAVNGKRRILIVDDEVTVRAFCKRALEDDTCEVVLAEGGEEAIGLLEEKPVDLVLLDLQMPEISGPEVLKAIRHHWEAVPVVIMTGYPDGDLMNQALAYGPVTVIAKPIPVAKLQECVSALCGKR